MRFCRLRIDYFPSAVPDCRVAAFGTLSCKSA
jgi:hypothetical protein